MRNCSVKQSRRNRRKRNNNSELIKILPLSGRIFTIESDGIIMNRKEIEMQCPAKINLALDVLRRRADGYHEVCMIMQEIGLCDTLFLSLEGEKVVLTSDCLTLDLGKDNLIVRAAELFFQAAGLLAGVKIHLKKRIPIGAGLAGGSTDAAGTLLGLNELYEGRFSLETLMELGGRLGADVPFCLMKGCALAEGIGTDLTSLPAPPPYILVLAKPPFSVSTAAVYGGLRLNEYTKHPNIPKVVEGLQRGDWKIIFENAGNVLEEVTAELYPQIREYEEIMLAEGAAYARMSGSGPSVFGIFFDRTQAERAAQRIKPNTREVFVL